MNGVPKVWSLDVLDSAILQGPLKKKNIILYFERHN